MSPSPRSGNYPDLELRIVEWAARNADIQAVVCYGSQALSNDSFDEFSDLDLLLFSSEPEAYTLQGDWLGEFANILLAAIDRTGAGDPEWFALYEGERKVDIILSRADPGSDLERVLAASPYVGALAGGVRVLYSSTDLAAPHPERLPVVRPDELDKSVDFENCVNRSLISIVKVATLLARGDLLRTLMVLDQDVRTRLIKMMELHQRTVAIPVGAKGSNRWQLEQWSDPDMISAFADTFCHCDPEDIRRALLASLKLLIDLAAEIASVAGERFPTSGQKQTQAWIVRLLSSRNEE